MSRPLPWTDIIDAIGEERFAEIKGSLDAHHIDDLNRDAFLLNGTVGQLLRDMMPDDAAAEAVNAYGALIHMMFVCWARDWPVVPAPAPHGSTAPLSGRDPPTVCYVQLPPNLVWAEPIPGEAHEPLDGAFAIVTSRHVHVLAVLGFRTGRDGFTTMEGAIALPAPAPGTRADGRPAFAAVMAGGKEAGLISLADEHELCALALLALSAAGS